jgi:hypothetical protein
VYRAWPGYGNPSGHPDMLDPRLHAGLKNVEHPPIQLQRTCGIREVSFVLSVLGPMIKYTLGSHITILCTMNEGLYIDDRWMSAFILATPMYRNICQCYLCVKGRLVQNARVQREIWRSFPHSKYQNQDNFHAVKVFLCTLHLQSNWFEHLSSEPRGFTLICDGNCCGRL